MNITGSIGNMNQGAIQTRPFDFGTDAIERQRVSAGQSLIDADFEYGLQATKWQTFSEIRKYPSFFEIPGSDIVVTNITSDQATPSIITVSTAAVTPVIPAVGSIITVQGLGAGNVSDRAQGLFIVTASTSGTSFSYQAKGQVNISTTLFTSYTVVRKGGFYNAASATAGNCKVPVSKVTQSGTTVTVTTSTPHGLIAGDPIAATGWATVTTVNGNWIVASVPTPLTFTYTASTGSGTDTSGAIYVQTYSYAVHRPFDGGVLISPAIPAYGATSVRQSKKVFRYQSGKGLIWSSGTLFCPNNDISGIVVGSNVQQIIVTTSIPHGSPQAGSTIQIRGVTTPGVNGTYIVTGIQDSFNVILSCNTGLSAGTSLILGDQPRFIISGWHGSSVRVGTFEDQNGLFWEFDGQTLWVVKRSSTFQLSGLVYCTANTQQLFGVGTRFGQQLKVGDKFTLRGMTHVVTSIQGDLQLTFNPPYRGAASIPQAQPVIACKIKEVRVPQSQFNRDTIDGKGSSGFSIDLTKMQMMGLQYTWYGAGFIDFMVRGADGNFVFAHRFKQNNINDEAYMRTGNMPVRYEIANETIHAVSTLASPIDTNLTSIVNVGTLNTFLEGTLTPFTFGSAQGITNDNVGNIYVSDNNSRIVRISPKGACSVVLPSASFNKQIFFYNGFIFGSTQKSIYRLSDAVSSGITYLNSTGTGLVTTGTGQGTTVDSFGTYYITTYGGGPTTAFRCDTTITLPSYTKNTVSTSWNKIPLNIYTGVQLASLLTNSDIDVRYNGTKFVFTGKTLDLTVIKPSYVLGVTSADIPLYYQVTATNISISALGIISGTSISFGANVIPGCAVTFGTSVGGLYAGQIYYVNTVPSSSTFSVSLTKNGGLYSPGEVGPITSSVITVYNLKVITETATSSTVAYVTVKDQISLFSAPSSLVTDPTGNLFIVNVSQVYIIPVGTTNVNLIANFSSSGGGYLAYNNGFLYLIQQNNASGCILSTILAISPYTLTTGIAGVAGVNASLDGVGTNAVFNAPYGITVYNNTFYVSQNGGSTIRTVQITPLTLTLNDPLTYWPNAGTALVDNELITYSGKSGNTLTGITRSSTLTYNINDVSTGLTHGAVTSHLGGTTGETVISLASVTPTVSGTSITVPGITIDTSYVNSVVYFGANFAGGNPAANTPYYILTVTGTTSFTLSASLAGTVITPTGAGNSGTFNLYKMPASVSLISITCCPSLTHWGSALIMDGLFDPDRGYLFNYQLNNFNIASPLSAGSTFNLFLLRLSPSVSNGVIGDIGSRDLLNRAQLLLQRLDVWAETGSSATNQGGSVVISGILNPSFSTTNIIPTVTNWIPINSLANGSQPSFAQVCNFGLTAATNNTVGTGPLTVGTYVPGSGERIFSTINNAGTQNSIDLSGLKEICNSVIGGNNFFPDGPDTLLIQLNIPTGAPTISNYSINLFWGEAQA